jgi:hypothetical protein
MKKYVSLAVLALLASSGIAVAQGFGGGRGGVTIEEDDDRSGRGGRGRDGIAVGEPRPDRGGRDRDRGRDSGRETIIIRTLPPLYRFVEERGRRCRIVITRRQRANGTIVRTERREC